MDYYSKQITKLIAELSTLPGIGAKSAQRLAFHILDMPTEEVEDLANAMVSARKGVHYCKQCYTLTDDEICPICSNPARDQKVIMVVEDTKDLAAYEKTGKYEGVYHVLHGAISPMQGIGPADIKLKELMQRLQGDHSNQFQSGGRDDSNVYQQTDQADRHQGIAYRERCSGRGRSGVH